MDKVWQLAERGMALAGRNSALICAALGIGIVRVLHGWILSASRIASIALDPHLLIDAGEIIAFLAMALLVRRIGPLCKRSVPMLAGILFAVAAVVLTRSALVPSLPEAAQAAGYLCSGLAHSVIILVWLEMCGCLAPLQAVLAIAGSYLVNLLAWFVVNGADVVSENFRILSVCVVGALLLVYAYRQVPADQIPVPTKDDPQKAGIRTVLSMRIVGWTALISLVYGIGDMYTQMGFSTLPSRLGNVIPLLILVVGLLWFAEHVDLRLLYRMSFVLMALGLTLVVLLEALPAASQTLMSAAQAASSIVFCAFACTSAHRRRESAIFGCGVLMAVALGSILLGNQVGSLLIAAGLDGSGLLARVCCTAIVLALLCLAAFIMRDEDLSSLVVDLSAAEADHSKRLDGASHPHAAPRQPADDLKASELATMDPVEALARLSNREGAVFKLMVQGKSAAEIGSELFIAQGTVRAHTSRIYEKLGVHTRKEFEALLGLG